VLSLLVGIAIWLAPLHIGTSVGQISSVSAHGALALGVTYTLMQVLTLWLFFAGLRNFKEGLRRPYTILCVGLICIALAQLQTPVALLAGAVWWLTSGAAALLYVAPNIFLFAGLRSFMHLLNIRSRWTLYRIAMPAVLVLPVVSFFLPVKLSTSAATVVAAHSYVALPMWQMGVNAICAYMAWRIQKTMGHAYTEAMRWLFIAMVTYTIMSIHFIILAYIGYDATWYGRTGAYLGVFAALGTVFVIAGYKFWEIGAHTERIANATAVDVVLYVASLSTNTHEIDPILDELRRVTARQAPGQPLTPDDERALSRVYMQLENYLTTLEPLRKLTAAGLRQRVNEQFPHNNSDSPFWVAIQTQPVQPARPSQPMPAAQPPEPQT
jgi:hypothetical protein